MPSHRSEHQQLLARVAACLEAAMPLKSYAFRSAGVKYANEEDFLSGTGASFYGGRWNPPGIRAIYASLDPITAVKESFHEFLEYGFSAKSIRPRVIAGVALKVECVLDLTDSRIRRRLGFSRQRQMAEDWLAIQRAGDESVTQAIGRGAFLAGFEGLLVPSARDRRGKNVVIFPECLSDTSVVALLGADELPPHPSDWPK